MRLRRVAAVILVLMMGVAAAIVARPYGKGLSFVIRAADMRGPLRSAGDIGARRVATEATTIGRLYRPDGTPRRFVLLVPGPHLAGIDEPRLVVLATQLAASGLAVVTPDIPELSRVEMTPAVTDAIEVAARAVADLSKAERTATSDGRIGLIGLTFSGGLSVVAGGRASLRDRLAFVVSIGGHHDFPSVVRYLCVGAHDSRQPDMFGTAIVLLNVADRLVPPRQVDRLRDAVRQFLSTDGTADTRRAEALATLKKLARSMPEPSAGLLRYLAEGDLVHLGSRLLPSVAPYASPPALSPSRSPKPTTAVFLLHGTQDNVVASSESEHLAGELVGHTLVRWLSTAVVSGAGFTASPRLGEALQLGSFWGEVLSR